MPAMRHLAALLSVAALAGCAADLEAYGRQEADKVRRTASSGLIGCPPTEITTSDHEKLTWTATCKGKVFYCTAGDGTACKERLN